MFDVHRYIIVPKENGEEKAETFFIKTSGNKQSVGIHTDITFELSENKTGGKSAEDFNDNQEVPVYLGTDMVNGRPNSYRPNFPGTNDGATSWMRYFPLANDWTTEKYSSSTRKYKSKLMHIVIAYQYHFGNIYKYDSTEHKKMELLV